ncbi:MAG TPA: D-glucuronyl C5-epimerase family protein, partial [Thermoleophilaceae bacterium]|nr:D-glucuronyl C5-epimerase family protein [Thermoleophilaceae bacterium]
RRTALAAVVMTAVCAAPAQAGTVIEVGGKSAHRVDDPAVPTRAEIALSGPARATASVRAHASSKRGRRAVYRVLRRELRRKHIKRSQYRRWRATYVRSIRTLRRLRGARATQLRYVLVSVESLALRRRLIPSRMPAVFLQLERNRQYWPRMPYPAVGDQVSFRGSELLYQYFAGEGLQLHPLSIFKKANHLHGFCERREPTCDEAALRRILDEMTGLAVKRGRGFIAWEYLFYFGGGTPPWMSGMAQATGIQALGRAARLLNEPKYDATARRALGAFSTAPPTGVRTTGPGGGVHYLQYSFAPRLYIFNAFLQSLIGLYDFSNLAGDDRARSLYADAIAEGRTEVPMSDVGDWSLYNYRGHEANRDYHELMREFLQSLCSRRQGAVFCEYARKYRGYQVDPPTIDYEGPATATEDEPVSLKFSVSKLSAVQVTVTRPDGRVVFDRLATFRRGSGTFTWTPRGPSTFTVRVAAKELRTGLGKRDTDSADVVVENRPG